MGKELWNRGVVDVAPYCHFCYIIAFDRMQYFRLDPCRNIGTVKGRKMFLWLLWQEI